MSNRC